MTARGVKIYSALPALAAVGLLLLFGAAHSAKGDGSTAFNFTYSGRLTDAGGAPQSGTVDIGATFWTSAEAGSQLGSVVEFPNVLLTQGVFTLNIALEPKDVTDVFGDGSEPVFVQITVGGKNYPRQRFSFTPLALRIPVDSKSVEFDKVSGHLGIKGARDASGGQVLTSDGTGGVKWDAPNTSNLSAKTIDGSPPSVDQVLTFKDGKWVAARLPDFPTIPAAVTALVGDVVATGPGTGTATLANITLPGTATKVTFDVKGRVTAGSTLDASDITSALGYIPLATGIVDADIAATASIDQSKVAGLPGALAGKENAFASGSTLQYFRGDKTWQSLTTASVPESGSALYFTDARAKSAISAALPIKYSADSGTISLAVSNGTTDGYLASSDWVTFNTKQNALGFLPLNKSGDSMSGVLEMSGQIVTGLAAPSAPTDAVNKSYVDGADAERIRRDGTVALTGPWAVGNDLSNVGNLIMARAKTLGFGSFSAADEATMTSTLDGSGAASPDKGKTWFNQDTNQLKYWNGSSAQALGIAGAGVTSLNGLTSSSQMFIASMGGSSPSVSSSGSVHTLTIPMASAGAEVTAGLLSNADYAAFSSKQASGNYVTSLYGDVTSTGFASGSVTTTLASVAIAGTSTKVTYDVKGRVLSGASLTAADIPALNAGIITSGNLNVANGGTGSTTLAANSVILGNGTSPVQVVAPGTSGNVLTSNGTTWQSTSLPATTWATPGTIGSTTPNTGAFTSITSNAEAGYEAKPFGTAAGNTSEVRFDELAANGTNYVGFKAPDLLATNRIWTLPAADGTAGQVLKTDGVGNLSWVSAATGSVTSVGITAPAAGITVTGSPITSSGNMTVALSNDLAALEALATTGGVERTAADTWATYTLTAAGKALLDDADATAQRATLGLGVIATASAVSGGVGGTITDNTITDADISSSAAIADSKLAVISSAGKVSGAAITSGTIAGSTAINTSGQIVTSGRIGIGSANPAYELDVTGTIRSSTRVSAAPVSDMNKGVHLFSNNQDGATAASYQGGIESWHGIGFKDATSGNTNIMFDTRSGQISTTGNVGIGTTNTASKLTVMDSISGLTTGLHITPYHTPSVIAGTKLNAYDADGTTVRALALQSNGGNVGIGNSTPTVKLQVSGGQAAGSFASNATGSIDWNNGNIQTTSVAAGNISMSNMVDGAGYTLIINNTTGGNYTLSSPGLTFRCNPACPVNVTAGMDTVLAMVKGGTKVWVTWTPGFQ